MNADQAIGVLKVALTATALAVTYCLPMLVATRYRHPRRRTIATLNVLLGWTLLGWVAALAWAMKRRRRHGRPG